MNKQDLDLVNKTLSNIGDKIIKAVDLLENNELSDKEAREQANEILGNLLMTIPVFIEVKK